MKIVCLDLSSQTLYGIAIAFFLTLAIVFDLLFFAMADSFLLEPTGSFQGGIIFAAILFGLFAVFIVPIHHSIELIRETQKLQKAEARKRKRKK